jgi:hypothetical protein
MMNATGLTSIDPTLQRLHEVTERIRRRAAEERARLAAKARRPPRPAPRSLEPRQSELPLPLPAEQDRRAA